MDKSLRGKQVELMAKLNSWAIDWENTPICEFEEGFTEAAQAIKSLHQSEDEWRERWKEKDAEVQNLARVIGESAARERNLLSRVDTAREGWTAYCIAESEHDGKARHDAIEAIIKALFSDPSRAVEEQLPDPIPYPGWEPGFCHYDTGQCEDPPCPVCPKVRAEAEQGPALEFPTYGFTCEKCGERDCSIAHVCAVESQWPEAARCPHGVPLESYDGCLKCDGSDTASEEQLTDE